MAVIKCSNCENEILDNEIVCPYCDCPLSETIKKMKKEDLASFSTKSVDELTGKIPVIKTEEEPKLATSSDFEKEKAAILRDLNISTEETPKEDAEKDSSDLEKTVKISREEILNGKVKSETASGVALKEKTTTSSARSRTSSKSKKKSKRKVETKYIILAVTVVGIILIASLISKITDTISDGINRQKKTNKTVEVTSSAEEIAQQQGFSFSSSTLTITDEKVMKDYESAEDTPWYQYRDTVKHVTISGEVTKIGAHSFEGFKNITDVTFSKSVTVVGDLAFYNCTSLKKVRLPDDNELMEIGKSAFELCENLELVSGYTKEAKFEPSIIAIGDRAFAHCTSITEFKLPDDITLGEDVFVGCSDDFAIICSESGNAYDYALENDIPIKEDFDMSIIEKEAKEEEEEEETSKETSETSSNENESTQTPENNSSNGTAPTEQPPQTPETPSQSQEESANNAQTLEDLSKKLTEATTPEEQLKILEEMEKYY